MLHFLQIEGKTLHPLTSFIAILTLLWWSGTEPPISPRYAHNIVNLKKLLLALAGVV